MKIITKEMIEQGYKSGYISLTISSHGDGVVAQIGEYWFYFDGITAEEYDNIDQYKHDIPLDTIIKSIYDTLTGFQISFPDEYLYYYYYLMEHLSTKCIKATFTSVWNDNIEITTNCLVNMKTKEVYNIETASDENEIDQLNTLEREFITINNIEYDVFNKDLYDIDETMFWYN